MIFSPQQQVAITKVTEWLKTDEKIFRLFGFAGTGKTTVAMHLIEQATGIIQFGAFTGKACQVMRSKGMHNAATLHSLMYKSIQDHKTGLVNFILNEDGPLSFCDLLVVDEVSMVGEDMGKDLMKFPMKILVLGDPWQLPPIKGTGFFTDAAPDHMLTEIHRQALESPILRFSQAIREGRAEQFEIGEDTDMEFMTRRDQIREVVMEADQVIVGRNKTREMYNERLRQLKGFEGVFPNVGERLICLKNNATSGFYNGSMWELVSMQKPIHPKFKRLRLKSLDNETAGDADIHNAFFEGGLDDLHWTVKKESDEFTFGYAITGHKSQGSQWNNVCLFDESYCFGEMADRWLYTCVTRAAHRLTVVM